MDSSQMEQTQEFFGGTDSIKWMHERDRFGNPNVLTTENSSEYVTGVAINFAIVAGFGIVCWILCCVLSALACFNCCCCKNKTQRVKQQQTQGVIDEETAKARLSRTRKRGLLLKSLFFAICSALAACAFVSISQVPQMADGLQQTLDVTKGLSDLTQQLSTQSTTLASNTDAASEDAAALADELRSSPHPDLQAKANDADSTASILATAASAARSAGDSIGDVKGDLDDAYDSTDGISGTAKSAGYAYSSIFVAWALIVFTTLLAFKPCLCTFRCSMLVGLVILLLAWLVTGALLLLGMVSSDICVAPTENTLSIIAAPGQTDDFVKTAKYYMTCDPNGENLEKAGAALSSADAVEDIDSSVQTLMALRSDIATLAAGSGAANATLMSVDELIGSVNATRASAVELAHTLECSAINSLWRQVVEGYCDKMVQAVVVFFACQLASAILLVLLFCVALPFCQNHPSRTKVSKSQKGEATSAAQQQVMVELATT